MVSCRGGGTDTGLIPISFFPNGLLAVAADKTEIWNLSNDSIITALSERTARNVNALQSIYFMNKTCCIQDKQVRTKIL